MSRTTPAIKAGYSSLVAACAEKGLTPAGAGFLAKSLDPFQDVQTVPTGIPDGPGVKTMILESKASAKIDKTTFGLTATTGTWTLNIANLPIVTNDVYGQVGLHGSIRATVPVSQRLQGVFYPDVSAMSSAFKVGTFTLMATTGNPLTATTAQLWPDCSIDNDAQYQLYAPSVTRGSTAFSPMGDFLDTPIYGGTGARLRAFRVVSQGFELVNTTPKIDVGGSVTVYRVNSVFDRTSHNYNHLLAAPAYDPENTEWVSKSIQTKWLNLPANDVSNVTNLASADTWDAERGVYCVAALDTATMCNFIAFTDRDAVVGANYLKYYPNTTSMFVTTPPGVDALDRVITFTDNFQNPLMAEIGGLFQHSMPDYIPLSAVQTSGCIFSELPMNSTFRMDMRITIEYVPLYCDPDIQRAPALTMYDDQALLLYHRVVPDLPAGCPVHDNGAGDWFRSVMDLVLGKASIVGGAISAALIGSAVPGAMIGRGVQAAWSRATAGQKRQF